MKGTITIKVTEHGYGIDADLDEVSSMDKMECMHSLACVLQMDKQEMHTYTLAESIGIFEEAGQITHCVSDEELENLLQGVVENAMHMCDTEVK